MLPMQPNQSLIDGLACLQAVTAGPAGVRELARTLQMEPTRVHRLLRTLAHLGLARQDAQRRYHAGPGVHVLAAMSLFASGLMPRALAPLETLRDTGLVVALGVRWLDRVAYLYHADARVSSLEGLGRVPPYPATQSGLGIALLAHMAEPDVRALYRTRDLPHFASLKSLLEELRATRRRGYADLTRDDGERTIAAAVPEPVGPPTVALGVAGRIAHKHVPELARRVVEAAARIAAEPKETQPPATPSRKE